MYLSDPMCEIACGVSRVAFFEIAQRLPHDASHIQCHDRLTNLHINTLSVEIETATEIDLKAMVHVPTCNELVALGDHLLHFLRLWPRSFDEIA